MGFFLGFFPRETLLNPPDQKSDPLGVSPGHLTRIPPEKIWNPSDGFPGIAVLPDPPEPLSLQWGKMSNFQTETAGAFSDGSSNFFQGMKVHASL